MVLITCIHVLRHLYIYRFKKITQYPHVYFTVHDLSHTLLILFWFFYGISHVYISYPSWYNDIFCHRQTNSDFSNRFAVIFSLVVPPPPSPPPVLLNTGGELSSPPPPVLLNTLLIAYRVQMREIAKPIRVDSCCLLWWWAGGSSACLPRVILR